MADVIQITIDGNAAGLLGAVGQSEAALGRLEGSATKAGSGIQTALGVGVVAAAAGLGAALTGAVASATNFEKGLSAISAVSGATKEQLDGIRATALQLGKDTSFSASEAAAGMEEMVKAGVSLNDVMGGAGRAALDLAAAGGLSVAESATIASNAMNVFSLKGSDMAHVADVIAGAANASAIDVHDFGFSLSAVGAVAGTVGLSLEDTATSIAVLGQAGLRGSDAGTSLKTMLLNLNPASKAAQAEMRNLGIITADGSNRFFDATGKVKSMAEVAQVLQDSMKNLTKEQQINALQVAFGTDAIRAAAIMAKAGAAGFNEMAEAESKVSAQDVANERLNNLAGSIEMLKGSLETGAIILGGMFTPALKSLADMVTGEVNQAVGILEKMPAVLTDIVSIVTEGSTSGAFEGMLEDMGISEATVVMVDDIIARVGDAFRALIPIAQAVWATFVKFSAPIAAFSASFLGVVGVAGLVTAAVGATAAVLGLLLSPLGLAALAAGALAAAWTANWGDIQGKTAEAWAAIQPALAALVDWLGTQIPPVLQWLSDVGWPALVAAGQAAADWIVGTAIPAFQAIVEWLGTNIPPVITWISDVGWPALVAAGIAVSDWIATVAIPAFTQLVDWLGPQISAVVTWITETGWPGLVAAGMAVSEWITGTAIPAFTALVDWLGPKINAVTTWISDTGWPALVTAGTAVGTMVTAVTTFFQALYVELDRRGVFTELGDIWGTLTAAGTLVWQMVEIAVGWWVKLHDALLPVQADVGALVGAGMLAKLSTDMDAVGKSTQTAIDPINLIGAGIQFMVGQVTAILAPIANFIKALNDLKAIIANFPAMPSFSLPGMGGGGGIGTQTLSYTPGGGGADSESKLRTAYQIALQKGYSQDQANALLGTLRVEGGLQGATGDSGKSHGPMQLYEGGQFSAFAAWVKQQGIVGDPKELAKDITLATTFALDTYYGDALKRGTAAGLSGPALATYAQRTGQVSINPEKAGAAYGPPAGGAPPVDTGGQGMVKTLPPGTTGLGGPASEIGPDQFAQTPEFLDRVIKTAPAWVQAMADIKTSGTDAFGSVLTSATDLGNGATLTITQMGTDVTATITDAAGNITGQWTTMTTGVADQTAALATDVPAQTAAMGAGVLTSVTDLGTGVLTTMQDMSGTTIATVTDMAGQVTSQSATLASGVSLSMADMGTQSIASVDAMTGNITTVMTDMAGNTVTTVTTASGQVVSQFATMSTQAGSSVAQLANTSKKAFGAVGSAAEDAQGPIEDLGSAMEDIPTPDLSDAIGEFKKLQKAAEAAGNAVHKVSGGDFKKSESAASAIGGHAGGGWVGLNGPELSWLGERGPEYVIPNNALRSAGNGGTTIIVNVNVGGSVTSERDLIEAVRDGLIGIGRRNASDVLSGGGGS